MEWVFLIWALIAGSCAIIASNKNRSATGWLVLGIVFGVFALIVIIAISANPENARTEPTTTLSGWVADRGGPRRLGH